VQEPSPYFIRPTVPFLQDTHTLGSASLHADDFNFRNYWRVLHKHSQLIAAMLLAALVLCIAYLATATSQYTAKSTILIEPGAAQIYSIENNPRGLNEPPAEDIEHDYYKTQYDILASVSLATEVIRDLDLQADPYLGGSRQEGFIGGLFSNHEKWTSDSTSRSEAGENQVDDGAAPTLIDGYLKKLEISPKLGTSLVVVSFTSPDPGLSARIVNAHVRTYIRQTLELRNQSGKNAQEFLEQKLIELKQRVEKSEAALNQYRRERGIVTFSLNDKGDVLSQRLSDLNADLSKAVTSRIVLESQHQRILKGDYESLPEVIGNPLVQKLKEDNAQSAAEYASMSNRFRRGYHPLDDLKVKLDENKSDLNGAIHAVAVGVEADYRAAVAKEAKLQDEITEVKAQALALNDASLQDAVLVREVQSSRQLYKAILERMNEIGVSTGVPASNVSVVDPAKPPKWRSSPKLILSLAVSLFLGLAGGLALAFFVDSFDDRLKSPRQVETFLGLPTLGSVPDFEALQNQRGYGQSYLSKLSPSFRLENKVNGKSSNELVVTPQANAASEAYRAIRTAIVFSRAGSPPKSVLISSAVLGEGKTISSVNIAAAFGQMGGRVLIIDADVRRPRCHKILNLDNGAGLTNVLVGQTELHDAIHVSSARGVFLLSAGVPVPSPAELLGSKEMQQLLATVGEQFDYVFVDSAPIMPVSDALALSTMLDGVLLVVSAQTPRQAVHEACDRLGHVGARVLGVVLNKLDVTSPDFHYHHRYSYRYSYHYYSSGNQSDSEPF
jgi:capsular exopolysaccharide synthesis family protein